MSLSSSRGSSQPRRSHTLSLAREPSRSRDVDVAVLPHAPDSAMQRSSSRQRDISPRPARSPTHSSSPRVIHTHGVPVLPLGTQTKLYSFGPSSVHPRTVSASSSFAPASRGDDSSELARREPTPITPNRIVESKEECNASLRDDAAAAQATLDVAASLHADAAAFQHRFQRSSLASSAESSSDPAVASVVWSSWTLNVAGWESSFGTRRR